MEQELFILSRKELKRASVLECVLAGSMSPSDAAESLGISNRQVRRLKARYMAEGAPGLIHGNRGRKPKHALPEEKKEEVLRLFEEKYYDTNFCHCSELLERNEGIVVSPASVGRILKASGRKTKHPHKRRPSKHRPRERRSQAGMLWQIDATPYEWLDSGSGRFALHAAVDDATGIVTGACFMPNECMEGHSETMRQGIERYGVPLALYSDKHTIFRSPNEKLSIDEELDGVAVPLSDFGKAMAELSIEHIKAATPQAKGRIERLWKTLQDRLPAELRLLGISNIKDANTVLPGLIDNYNARFSVKAAESANAHQTLGKDVNLDYVFTKRETRRVGCGSEIAYKNGVYVPLIGEPCPAARTIVEVRESFSGGIVIWHKGRVVKLRKVEKAERRVTIDEAKTTKTDRRHIPHTPPADHPWRGEGWYKKRVYDTEKTAATGV